MSNLPASLLTAAFLLPLQWISPAAAQSPRPAAAATIAQAERNAVDLKQGMSVDEVERLLGKPRRTALKSNGNSLNASSPGTLQWTYSWAGASSSPAVLQVEFAAKAQEAWYVNSWEWLRY